MRTFDPNELELPDYDDWDDSHLPDEPGDMEPGFCDRWEDHGYHVYNGLNGRRYRCWGITQTDIDEIRAESGKECEHGLSASLCAGPGHYPMDNNY